MSDSFVSSHPIAMRVGGRRMSIPRRRSRASDTSTSPSTSPESARDLAMPHPKPDDVDDYPRPRAAAPRAASPPPAPGTEATMENGDDMAAGGPDKTNEGPQKEKENRRQRREREHGHGHGHGHEHAHDNNSDGYASVEHQQAWNNKYSNMGMGGGSAHARGSGGARIVQPEGKGFM